MRRDVQRAFHDFFLETFPQICIGLGEHNWGPAEAWLPIDKAWIPGHPGLAEHITGSVLRAGFDPAADRFRTQALALFGELTEGGESV